MLKTAKARERCGELSLPHAALAKYLRELMIHALNLWFGERVPELAPTAGYYVDGRRFLADIESFARRADLPLSRLVRVR